MTIQNDIVDDGSFKTMDAYVDKWNAVLRKWMPSPLNTFALSKDDLPNLDIWLAEVVAASMCTYIEHYEEATHSKAMRKHKRLHQLAVSYSNTGGAEARKKFPDALAKTFRTLWF